MLLSKPPHFIILSGDVHYSFVYDIRLRRTLHSPNITQVTCSGIKNQFPDKLLNLFARLNHWLYGCQSPLNWFTQRRDMRISARGVNQKKLVNQSGIGLLEIDEDHKVKASVITTKQTYVFKRSENE